VEHTEPRIKYVYRSRNRTEEFILTTDGTDQVRDEPKGESRISARWDGDVLEIRSYRKSQSGEATMSERWSLGRDGIVIVRNPAPAEESRMVFRRKH
jgi:hypothetical protein